MQPAQDGSGGTDNFQLRPTFWFGMAMCDDQSAPNPDLFGLALSEQRLHAGQRLEHLHEQRPDQQQLHRQGPGRRVHGDAVLPAGLGQVARRASVATRTRWCAALNIDSFSENSNTGVANNAACLNSAGIEPVNFAFLTKNGSATDTGQPAEPGTVQPLAR